MPVAGAAGELVAVVGLLGMMKMAQPDQPVEFGDAGVGPAVDVVDLEVPGEGSKASTAANTLAMSATVIRAVNGPRRRRRPTT